VPWVELFAVLAVSHLVGDFVLQTEWQAQHKHGGLGRNPMARRALLAHVLTYTLVFVPALVWIADSLDGGRAAVAAALIAGPHLIQDDYRLLRRYMVRVKHMDPDREPVVAMMVDQSLHFVVLLLTALLIGD
jgi:Protein of unknown function (DUF3307)